MTSAKTAEQKHERRVERVAHANIHTEVHVMTDRRGDSRDKEEDSDARTEAELRGRSQDSFVPERPQKKPKSRSQPVRVSIRHQTGGWHHPIDRQNNCSDQNDQRANKLTLAHVRVVEAARYEGSVLGRRKPSHHRQA